MTPTTTQEKWKNALISVLIGAGVTFLATLLEGLLDLIKTIEVDPAGIATGVIYYLKSWRQGPIA